MNPKATREEEPEMHAHLDRLEALTTEVLERVRALVESKRQS